MSSRKHLAKYSPTPYLACKYGYSDLPGYFQCAVCPCVSECDILSTAIFDINHADYYENLRAQSIENKAKYYRNEDNYWRNSEMDNDGWRKVKKDKDLKIIPRKFACDEGTAIHPDFWRCDTCSQVEECDIGKFRTERQRQKELEMQKKVENLIAPVKKFFERVSDFFKF